MTISSCPREGVCSVVKIFGSALLQPTRSVCISLSAFSFYSVFILCLHNIFYTPMARYSLFVLKVPLTPISQLSDLGCPGMCPNLTLLTPLFKFSDVPTDVEVLLVHGSSFGWIPSCRHQWHAPVGAPCGLRVVRIDPLHFLAGCRKKWLNQALSVLSLSLGFLWLCVVLFTRTLFLVVLFLCHLCVLSLGCSC